MKKQTVVSLILRLLIPVLLILLFALVPPRSMAQSVKAESETQAQSAPTTDSFEGCYELKLSRWWPWGFGEENDYVTPPSRIHLLGEHGTRGFEKDKPLIRTIPRQDPPPGSRESSYWNAKSQNELVLEWTDGFVGVWLRLAKNKDDLTGWAHPHFDAAKIIPRTAHVTARRITCEPDSGASNGGEARPHAPVQEGAGPISAETDWHRLDAGPFSISAPSGWEFRQLVGVDSYVGEFVGEGVALTFDFGRHSNRLKEEKGPAYVVVHKSIGGRRAKMVAPKTAGQGITGVYFRDAGYSSALSLFGRELTSTQQELVLEIFETLRFGGCAPRNITPPPPAKKDQ